MAAKRKRSLLRGLRDVVAVLLTAVAGAALASGVMGAAGSSPVVMHPRASQMRYERELHHAEDVLGIPAWMLADVTTQADLAHPSEVSVQVIDDHYTALYTQLVAHEQAAPDVLRQQTTNDIANLGTILTDKLASGLPELFRVQAQLEADRTAAKAATLPGDLYQVDTAVLDQTAALNAMLPASTALNQFQGLLAAVPATVRGAATVQAEYAQDAQDFASATTADDYTRLNATIANQTNQLVAGQALAVQTAGPSVLGAMQSSIDQLAHAGMDVKAYQQQHDADAQSLASVSDSAGYAALAQTLAAQEQSMALPLMRLRAEADVQSLAQRVASAQSHMIVDPATGGRYPAAYEYASKDLGIGAVEHDIQTATTLDDLAKARARADTLSANLNAMLQNMGDSTPYNKPHKSDLALLGQDGLLQGKTLVVSLREQAVRLYDNGKLVFASPVTTGQPVRPSPPGLHYAMQESSPAIFLSSDPPNSPLWFAPTHINYAILYFPGGYFLHDAWWRTSFGPGTNLPHYDPAAFNGGSHGCVNIDKQQMAWIYQWTPVGTPILVY